MKLHEMGLRTARQHVAEAEFVLRALEDEGDGAELTAAEVREYSIVRAIGEIADMIRAGRPWRLSGIEGEAHRALVEKHGELATASAFYVPLAVQRRDLNAATGGAGGHLVGSTTGGSYIEQLRARSVVLRLGAQRLPGQRENLLLPRQAGAATAAWLSNETAQAPESTQGIQQLGSGPKTVAAYTEISRQLTKQSNPAAEQLVMTDLAAVSALALDAAALNGSGAAGEPLGLLGAAGVGTFGGTSLGLDALAEAQADVLTANALLNPATLGYATTPAVAKLLKGRQRFTGTDSPLWGGPLHDGAIEGVRATSSTQVPTATMCYGDWSQILVPEWGVLAIELDPYANFPSGIIGVRALWSCDVIVRHAGSFTVATSIT